MPTQTKIWVHFENFDVGTSFSRFLATFEQGTNGIFDRLKKYFQTKKLERKTFSSIFFITWFSRWVLLMVSARCARYFCIGEIKKLSTPSEIVTHKVKRCTLIRLLLWYNVMLVFSTIKSERPQWCRPVRGFQIFCADLPHVIPSRTNRFYRNMNLVKIKLWK